MHRTLLIFSGAVWLAAPLPAQSLKVIHPFAPDPDGAYPQSDLVLEGNTLYGTTSGGGGPPDNGTVFKVNTDGTSYSVLKRFTNSLDGGCPVGLVLNGSVLYGTTYYGGSPGGGTVFKLGTNGTDYAILKTFPPQDNGTNSDGSGPGELLSSGATLYGTTYEGGSGGNGTVFKINTNGTGFTVLKTFSATIGGTNSDGANPDGGLVLGGGTLFGTARYGGGAGSGTVFRIGTNGTGFTVLKTFLPLANGTNYGGANPEAVLVLTANTLYGTAAEGGPGAGTVFKLDTNGSGFTVLKDFLGGDGAFPVAGLLLSGSTLYGTTYYGGRSGRGVIFKVNTDGTDYAVLKSFAGSPEGEEPAGGLVRSGSTLYGVTYLGGITNAETDYGYGTVFGLTVPPQIQVNDGSFGVRTNCFGFNVTGFSNQVAFIEACTNPPTANWLSLQTNLLGDKPLYFRDSAWTNYPRRFYRVGTQ